MSTQIDAQMHKQTQTKANSHMRTHTQKKTSKRFGKPLNRNEGYTSDQPSRQAKHTQQELSLPKHLCLDPSVRKDTQQNKGKVPKKLTQTTRHVGT